MRLAATLSSLLLLACANKSAPDPETLALLSRLHAADPADPVVLYTYARVREKAGDTTGALTWLYELEASGFDDALEPDDFPATLARADARVVARRLAGRARVKIRSELALTVDANDLYVEGQAHDPRRDRFLLGSGRHRKVVAVDRQGRTTDLTAPKQDGLLGVLGVKVDAARDQVWVASTATPFMIEGRPEDAGRSTLHAFDLATGATRAALTYARAPSLLNDLDVAADGAVYATDSHAGAVVVARDGQITDLVAPGSFDGPNGIALAPAGDALYVADFRGISRVDLATRAVARLEAPAPARSLGGIDGLYVHDGALVGVQNLLGRGRVWRLPLGPGGTSLRAAEILETGRPDYTNPTTGTFADGSFYYLANPQLRRGERLKLLRLPLSATT